MASGFNKKGSGNRPPEFDIPDQPELEEALNRLSEYLRENPIPAFTSSESIRAAQGRTGEYAFHLLDDPNKRWNVRFRVSYEKERDRIYVDEGLVAFVPENKGTIVPIMPFIDVEGAQEVPLDGQYGSKEERPFLAAPTGGSDAGTEFWVLVKASMEEAEVIIHNSDDSLPELAKGQFYFLIAKFTPETTTAVGDGDGGVTIKDIEQTWGSDITLVYGVPGSSVSGSGGGGGSGSLPPESSALASSGISSVASSLLSSAASEGSKDTAIVKVPSWFNDDGYAALYVKESPEVKFDDNFTVKVTGRRTRFVFDKRFLVVCAPDSIRALATGDTGWVGAKVEHCSVTLTTSIFPWCRPKEVEVLLIGTRKNFDKSIRFAPRTKEQYDANNAAINAQYPRYEPKAEKEE